MHVTTAQNLTITHKLDPTQFAALLALLTQIVSSDDPAAIAALTAKLHASEAQLESAVTKTK